MPSPLVTSSDGLFVTLPPASLPGVSIRRGVTSSTGKFCSSVAGADLRYVHQRVPLPARRSPSG